MAMISISFAISLLTYHLLNKFGIYETLALWSLRRFWFYLPPTKDALRISASVSKPRPKDNRKNRQQDHLEDDSFFVPNNLDIDLQRSQLQPDVLGALRFYHDYKWVINVFLTAVISYVLTELYYNTKDWALDGEIHIMLFEK